MDSIPMETCSSVNKKEVLTSGITDLSPITNLTLNLSGLSTSVTGTPIRRISWSNAVPVRNKIELNTDASCAESPTFKDIFPRRNKSKRTRRCISKVLPSDSEDEKENIIPYSNKKSEEIFEEIMPCSSQDSGYSCLSETHIFDSPSYLLYKSSSCFTDDEDHGFENIIKEEANDLNGFSPVPKCMFSLLSNPLSKTDKSPHRSFDTRYVKLPIRRCLSMDMDSESDLSDTASKNETFITPSSSKENVLQENSNRTIFKRPEPPNNYFASYSKRRKSCASVETYSNEEDSFVFQRSYSETAATIMHALLKADLQPELVGDGSRSYALPLVEGRHQDLKSISPETLAGLLRGEFKNKVENYTLIDCRYPYEYEGGHIQGAKNIFTKEDIMVAFLEKSGHNQKKDVLIFHCEFSSERAPTLYRFLRNKDREMNEGNYPHLYHPEIYILEGGYKAFYEGHKELCEPQEYKPMTHKDHGFELRHFRAKSKSWGTECKRRSKLRCNSKQTLI